MVVSEIYMTGYELLLEEPADWKHKYHQVRKYFLLSLPFILFLISIFLFIDIGYKQIIISILFFCLSAGFGSLSILYIFSLSPSEVISIYNTKKELKELKSRISDYLHLTVFKSWKIWLYSSITGICAAIGFFYSEIKIIPFLNIGAEIGILIIVYITAVAPLKYVLSRCKGMYLNEASNAVTNIMVSCRKLNKSITDFRKTKKPIKSDMMEINILNILESADEFSRIDNYFRENMEPPSVLDYTRFVICAFLGLIISSVIKIAV